MLKHFGIFYPTSLKKKDVGVPSAQKLLFMPPQISIIYSTLWLLIKNAYQYAELFQCVAMQCIAKELSEARCITVQGSVLQFSVLLQWQWENMLERLDLAA